MSEEPIRQRIEVDADQAKRELEEIARATEKYGQTIKDGGEAAEAVTEKQDGLGKSTEGLIANLGGLITTLAGSAGVVALMDNWAASIEAVNRRLEENARISREAAESRLDLVALSGIEDEGTLNAIDEMAALSGRRPGEVARTLTLIRSATPNATSEQQTALLRQAAIQARISEAPLQGLADPLLTLFDATGDPTAASNILRSSIDQAREPDPGKLGPLIGRFIGLGEQLGGMTPGESAGLVAASTGLGMQREIAVTSIEAAVKSLRGDVSPQAQRILGREGIDTGSTLGALRQIGEAAERGDISPAELERIGGAEALRLFTALADPERRDDFFMKVSTVADAGTYEGDLAAEKGAGIFGSSRLQGLNLLNKRLESALESERSRDENALTHEAVENAMALYLERQVRAGKMTPRQAENTMAGLKFMRGSGASPIGAVLTARTSGEGLFGLGHDTFGKAGQLFDSIATDVIKDDIRTVADIERFDTFYNRNVEEYDPGMAREVLTIVNQYNVQDPTTKDSGRADR